MILALTMNYIFSCNNPCRSAGASKKNFRSSRIMTDLPPWRALKAKATKLQMDNELSEQVEWRTPEFILIDKHLRFYKDLLRSTERVELTLSHSGKKEVMEATEDPSEPSRASRDASTRPNVILIPTRTDNDPRMVMMNSDGSVVTRPEYQDETYLREMLSLRGRFNTPGPSKNPSPIGSPKQSGTSTPVNGFGVVKPSPPSSGGPMKPPPPPKAPPPEKRPRMSVG